MSNTNQNPTKEKALTKYDRKMQARKEAESQERRSILLSRIIAAVIVIAVVAILIAIPVVKSINANREYIRVGEHSITETEFDFYYNYYTAYQLQMYVNYGLIDPSVSLDTQMYNSTTSYAQYFENYTLQSLTQTLILNDDAEKNGLTYDVSAEYDEFYDSIRVAAEKNNLTEKQYIQARYGANATKSNIKNALKGILIGNKHYNYLLEKYAPSSEEVEEYYTANQTSYDTVDYYLFDYQADVSKDASEEERVNAMFVALDKAADMELEFNNGTPFAELCQKYANESQKATYADPKACEKTTAIANLSSLYSEWLTSDDRVANDTNIFRDDTNNIQYLVAFRSKQRAANATDSIKNTLASRKITDFLNSVVNDYTTIDEEHHLLIMNDSAEDYSDITSDSAN